MKLAAGILAAGESKRFGSPKQVEEYNGRSLIEHAIAATEFVGKENLFVVLGAHAEAVQKKLTTIQQIINPDFEKGMGSSLKALIRHVQSLKYDALLIHLCDLPKVKESHLRMLVEAFNKSPDRALASSFEATLGPPLVVPAHDFSDFLQVDDAGGAKKVLKKIDCLGLPLPEAAKDIDFRKDLYKEGEN